MQVGLRHVPSTNHVEHDSVAVVCTCAVHLDHMVQYIYGRTGHCLSEEIWIAFEDWYPFSKEAGSYEQYFQLKALDGVSS